jgi:lysozyme
VADAVRDSNKLKKALGRETVKHLNEARARVIVEMIFNMGYPKVLQFKKMWEAIKQNDFKVAAAEMLNSRWATQVKGRAEVLAKIMEEGVDP